MTLRSLFFSAAILVSTATVAAAAPERGNRDRDRNDDRIEVRDRDRDIKVRDHRKQPRAWADLGTIRAAGKSTVFKLDRATSMDALRLEIARGSVQIKKVIITFADGSRHVTTVGDRLTTGQPEVIKLPDTNKRVASVEIRLGKTANNARQRIAAISLSAR